MSRTTIALAGIYRNEEERLPELVKSLLPVCDEFVIGVDTSSTDDTWRVASRLITNMEGCVFAFENEEFSSRARNRGLELVTSPWALVLDADERLSSGLIEWLQDFKAGKQHVDYDLVHLLEVHYIDGQPAFGTIEASSSWQARLIRSSLRYMKRLIHEGFDETLLRKLTGPADAPFFHYKTRNDQGKSDARNSTRPVDFTQLGHGLGSVKLNIGCGGDIRPGFINIDIHDGPGVNLVWDIRPRMKWDEHIYPYPGCLPWPDNSVDEILASHCIEHFIYHHAPDLVRDWIRMLKPGGRIEIITPDFDQVVYGYAEGKFPWLGAIQNLYAGEIEWPPSGCWYHYNCINWDWLYGQLTHWGCDPYSIARLPVRPEVKGILELRVEARKAGRSDLLKEAQNEASKAP